MGSHNDLATSRVTLDLNNLKFLQPEDDSLRVETCHLAVTFK
jgi:hypothetical protein